MMLKVDSITYLNSTATDVYYILSPFANEFSEKRTQQMIQDILPHKLQIEYKQEMPDPGSRILCFNNQDVLIKADESGIEFPRFRELKDTNSKDLTYLFKLDAVKFFLYRGEAVQEIPGYKYENTSIFRKSRPKAYAFAGITALQLNNWYSSNIYCGACSNKLKHSDTERMLYCKACNRMVYPCISPAVIVAVHDGDRLLMTKYAGRPYVNYSLIAGFIEIGETPEDAACREVFEETGVKIKNLRYYKSQPWGYSNTLLLGYTAELDGDDTIKLDETELSEAGWFTREDIATQPDDFSLTNEMICSFKARDF